MSGQQGPGCREVAAGAAAATPQEALRAIDGMIARSVGAQQKLRPGTSPHTLQKNRIQALRVAAGLVQGALPGGQPAGWDLAQLRQARAPLASLASKSGKALGKLAPGSWQHTMLQANLAALGLATTLLERELEQAGAANATHTGEDK